MSQNYINSFHFIKNSPYGLYLRDLCQKIYLRPKVFRLVRMTIVKQFTILINLYELVDVIRRPKGL